MKKVTIDGVSYTLTSEEQIINHREVDEHTTCSSCYGEINEGDSLVTSAIINPENGQKLIHDGVIAHTECAEYDSAKRELTLTSQYHDWSGTAADDAESMITDYGTNEQEYIRDDEIITRYNNIVSDANACGCDYSEITEDMGADEVIETITRNAR